MQNLVGSLCGAFERRTLVEPCGKTLHFHATAATGHEFSPAEVSEMARVFASPRIGEWGREAIIRTSVDSIAAACAGYAAAQEPRVVGHSGSACYRTRAPPVAWVWAVCVPYAREYAAGELDGAPWTLLRAVQLLAMSCDSLMLVLPAREPAVPCGPLAELFAYFVNTWAWFAPKRQRTHHNVRVVLADAPEWDIDTPHVVWVSASPVHADPERWDAVPLSGFFAACSVGALPANPEVWRAQPAPIGRLEEGVLTGAVTIDAPRYAQQAVLRNDAGEFRGFWLGRPDAHRRCTTGDPSLLTLGDEALLELARLLRPAGGPAVLLQDRQFPVVDPGRAFVYRARPGETPPVSGFAHWSGGSDPMALTDEERDRFAALGWVAPVPPVEATLALAAILAAASRVEH